MKVQPVFRYIVIVIYPERGIYDSQIYYERNGQDMGG